MTTQLHGVRITGVGKAVPGYDGVPGRIVSNAQLAYKLIRRGRVQARHQRIPESDLEKFLEPYTTSDKWIRTRTGIERRSFASDNCATSDLAIIAVRRALECSGLRPDSVERLELATVTPDHHASPPTVNIIANKVGLDLSRATQLGTTFGCDTGLACCSFGVALQNSYSAIASGVCCNAVVVGADKMSGLIDWHNRNFAVILGDAAAALVLERCSLSESSFTPDGFYAGMNYVPDRIVVRAGGSRQPYSSKPIEEGEFKLWMDGPKVFGDVLPMIFSEKPGESIIGQALCRADLLPKDLDWIFFHQANLRFIDPIEKKLRKAGFVGKICNNIHQYGNTTSAAIPLLLAEAHEQGFLEFGQRCMTVVYGGSYSWATSIFLWTVNEC